GAVALGDMVCEPGLVGLGLAGWRRAEVERLPPVCLGGCHVFSFPHVVSSPSHRSARRPGAKQYSPPRVTTKGGSSCRRRRMGRWGIVKLLDPLLGPTRGSISVGAPMKMPSFSHGVLTNSTSR